MSLLLIGIGAIVAYNVFWYLSSWRHNISEAKRSGLPYVVVPLSSTWRTWQFTHKLFVPVIKKFPKAWWEPWLEATLPGFSYQTRHQWHSRLGESFLIVSPGKMSLVTDNAEAIRTISLKREKFPKWTDTYAILRMFGENVVTSEGAVWRMHRKVTSPTFNERNAVLVFGEAIHQTRGLLRTWTGPTGATRKEPLKSVQKDTLKLALNIIGYVGFGLRLLWPGETLPPGTDPKLVKYGSLEPPHGHSLSFFETMEMLMDNVLLLLMVPRWILKWIPHHKAKEAVTCHDEYIKYMDELLDEKIEDARRGDQAEEGMDLMGQLAKSSYGKDISKDAAVLSREDIVGNAFIMFVAGHETTANTMHFTLIQLATNPEAQRKVQKALDDIVGDTDPSTWDYDSLVNPMTGSMLGACLNETLRLLPPVVEIPKIVSPHADESLVVDGKKYVVPKNTHISLEIVSVHANPRYWPTRPSKVHPGKSNILDYVPERWFQTKALGGSKGGEGEDVAGADSEDFGGFQGSDTNAQLFRPERGAYVPFSDGARSCLGRRIAVVEMIAAMAVIFQSYSLELAVDEWASQEQVDKMSREERARIYKKAQDKSRWTIDQAITLLTLKLQDGHHVPVRLVKRGEEKFVDWVDK